MRSILIALVFATGVVAPAAGNIILVPSVHSTIQAGINAAAPGDTVQVGPGTYTGPSNRNLDFGGKNIVLRSSAGAATTIIDCQNLARGMRFRTGETAAAIVQGFTIRNGLASGAFGGGILVEGGASPTIRNCRFQSNHANTGGAIFVSSNATVSDCELTNNVADNYGGGAYAETGSLHFARCSFSQNAAGIGAGAAVLLSGALTAIDCSFTENTPANLGGGVYASGSTVTIERSTFTGNTGKNGAGAYILEGTATIDSCTFSTNTATYSGGGMHAQLVNPLSVTECTFQGNITETTNSLFDVGGGGLYMDMFHVPASQVMDCTFANNQALGTSGASGGGMRAGGYSADHVILRCTFIDNHADTVGGGAVGGGVYQDCVFEGNTGDWGGGLDGGFEVVDCRFTDNHALDFGGGCNAGGDVIRCEFDGNSAGNGGGGLYNQSNTTLFSIVDSRFSDNYASQGGAVNIFFGRPISMNELTGCTFVGNTASTGGALSFTSANPGTATISGCTFVANGGQNGGALSTLHPVEISNTIIAFGTEGEAIRCAGEGLGVMSCTDIFGNAGGDWTSCIADQVGINGNFSLDPLFCNRAGRDLTLAQASPCSPAHSPAGCGLIGAHPVACASPIGIADTGPPAVTPILRVTPNPMRGAGMIGWAGVGGRETELRLYDVAGRIVARRMETGVGGELPWSSLVGARDMPSGVYFLEMGERHEGARVRLVVVR